MKCQTRNTDLINLHFRYFGFVYTSTKRRFRGVIEDSAPSFMFRKRIKSGWRWNDDFMIKFEWLARVDVVINSSRMTAGSKQIWHNHKSVELLKFVGIFSCRSQWVKRICGELWMNAMHREHDTATRDDRVYCYLKLSVATCWKVCFKRAAHIQHPLINGWMRGNNFFHSICFTSRMKCEVCWMLRSARPKCNTDGVQRRRL